MTNWIQWEIADDDGENPLGKPAEFEFNVAFDYDPGDLGEDDNNGYLSSPPAATITGATCTRVTLAGDPQRAPTTKETLALAEWFLTVINTNSKLRQQIEMCGLDQMCVEPCYDDDWDD